MAVETVERALTKYGPPVYVFHEIVHNRNVVDGLPAVEWSLSNPWTKSQPGPN